MSMSASTIAAAVAFKPLSPMLARQIASACLDLASQQPAPAPAAPATTDPTTAVLNLRR